MPCYFDHRSRSGFGQAENSVLVRVFGNVMGFGRSAVVQGVMDIFVRRWAPHPLRQQGAEDHADHAGRGKLLPE